jgi:predicted acyltransferase
MSTAHDTPSASAKEAAAPAEHCAEVTSRLLSLDALRGFDMFWIVGAHSLVEAIHNMTRSRVTDFIAEQLEHVKWEGFHFEDLIFPLFVFIAGVSMTFSMDKAMERHGRRGALLRLARRCAALLLLGLFYYGGLSNPWPGIRLTGVLQTFGVACFLGGALYILFPRRPRVLAGACIALMLGYWALMAFAPFPDMRLNKASLAQLAAQAGSSEPAAVARAVTGRVRGVYEEGYNLANYLDYRYLPGLKQYGDGNYEAQGLLQMVAATSSCLIGILAGLWLRRKDVADARKVAGLFAAGAAGAALGFGLGPLFPVVKKLWSPSFALVAGGYSAMLLGTLYFIIEMRQWRRWCQPFVWIGMNSITIYLACNIFSFQKVAVRLAGGDVQQFLDAHVAKGAGGLLVAVVELTLMFLFVRFLYVRKIFLRV